MSFGQKLIPPIACTDFWSELTPEISLGPAPADISLPSVNVAGLPVGATYLRVVALIKFRAVENTNVAANSLQGLQEIQVAQGSLMNLINAIDLVDRALRISRCRCPGDRTRRWGIVIVGQNDLSSIFIGNATYLFQWTQALVYQTNLNFDDIQTGLRVTWQPST